MSINCDKPQRWKNDIQASVDLFNNWFINFAPQAYKQERRNTTIEVENGLRMTSDLLALTPETLRLTPGILPTMRMSTCPPLARDRLIGLSGVDKNLVLTMEKGKLPPRMAKEVLDQHLERITRVISSLLDTDLFPWLQAGRTPTSEERYRASTIIADRLCGAMSDPIIRNEQEKRQLTSIGDFLRAKGYREKALPSTVELIEMEPGTFNFRTNVRTGGKIPIDVIIQPFQPRVSRLPILIEAKSAGDFTNVNKRRKEEADKMHHLKETYGDEIEFILFLCGYFNSGYLGYEAAEGIDWVWEHRIDDLNQLGL